VLERRSGAFNDKKKHCLYQPYLCTLLRLATEIASSVEEMLLIALFDSEFRNNKSCFTFCESEEIKRYSTLYYNRLIGHENSYVTELRNPLHVRHRLKQQWPSDLQDQREEEE
jgi:hypothetical protein